MQIQEEELPLKGMQRERERKKGKERERELSPSEKFRKLTPNIYFCIG